MEVGPTTSRIRVCVALPRSPGNGRGGRLGVNLIRPTRGCYCSGTKRQLIWSTWRTWNRYFGTFLQLRRKLAFCFWGRMPGCCWEVGLIWSAELA